MKRTIKEYDVKLDAKKRITIRRPLYSYYHVVEHPDGVITLEPRELIKPSSLAIDEEELLDKIRENLSFIALEHKESYMVFNGDKNIMLSAPHAVDQLRNDKIKAKESEISAIGLYLAKEYNYPFIIKTHNYDDDANYDLESNYKDELEKQINERNIKCLIDLHQLSSKRTMDINLGINEYLNFPHKRLIKQIIAIFHKYGICDVEIDNPFKAGNYRTISNNMHNKTGIDTIQIEVNSRLLNINDEEKDNTANVASAIKDILDLLGDYYD